MRRTLALVGVVGLGAVLLIAVRPPEHAVAPGDRGHRVFRLPSRAVDVVEVDAGAGRFSARRVAGGWLIDDRPAAAGTAAALEDLVDSLVALRAVDVFRPRDRASYGLDHPAVTITVRTRHGARRVVLGESNAVGSAFYARRDDDPRVMQVGSGLLSALQRVFYERDRTAS